MEEIKRCYLREIRIKMFFLLLKIMQVLSEMLVWIFCQDCVLLPNVVSRFCQAMRVFCWCSCYNVVVNTNMCIDTDMFFVGPLCKNKSSSGVDPDVLWIGANQFASVRVTTNNILSFF